MRRCILIIAALVSVTVAWAGTNEPATLTTQAARTRRAARSGYPYLTAKQRPQKIAEALDQTTDENTRFYAVWGLAISGYTRESAKALAEIACDSKYKSNTRTYAGMGLRNFTSPMPEDVRKAIQDKLYGALEAEKDKLPDGVIRTLIAWGDADRVLKVLGDNLRDFYMEIQILQGISSRKRAVARLMEIYKAAPAVTTNIGWSRRSRLGVALIQRQDKRGIDILFECLTVKEPWQTDTLSPEAKDSEARSFRQCLHNTFRRLGRMFDDNFGYEAGGTWNPQLGKAIPKMVEWWKANRQTWSFEEATSTVLPKLVKGKALTKRQARVLAAKLATDAFAKRVFKHANGKPVGKIEIAPESFNDVGQKDGRWVLRMIRSRGPEAFVDFALDGSDAKVIVNYALR